MNRLKMIFMGRKTYGARMLRWSADQGIEVAAVCTEPGEAGSPVAAAAEKMNIPVMDMEGAERLVSEGGIDLVVSYLYGEKIKGALLDAPPLGCVNFHPAILPDWRGTGGYNIAILKKLPQWGATAHYVDEAIDTGPIIRVYKFDFDYRIETALTLEKKTQSIQMDLYRSVMLDIMRKGRLSCEPQAEKDGVYVSRKEMNEMKRIDPDRDDIDLKIRAFWFPPYDGAFIEVDGKKYTLVNREILESVAGDMSKYEL